MSTFSISFNAVFSLFFCMALGFIARIAGVVKRADVPSMNKLGFHIFMPFMLFYYLYSSSLSSSVNLRYLLFVIFGLLGTYVAGAIYVLLTEKDRAKKGVKIQGIYRNNIAVVGAAILKAVYPNEDIAFFMVGLSFCTIAMNILAVITLEAFGGKRRNWKALVIGIITNPPTIAAVLGICCLLTGVKLPAALDSAIAQVSRVFSPLMLFLLGAFFEFDGLAAYRKDLVEINLIKLVIAPAILMLIATRMGFRGIEYVGLIATFASSNATASFTMTQEIGGDASLAASIVVTTSVFSLLTLFLWLAASKALGLF